MDINTKNGKAGTPMKVKIEDLLGSSFRDKIGTMVTVSFIEVERDRVNCKLKPIYGSMYEYSFTRVGDGTMVELNGASDFTLATPIRRATLSYVY